MLSDAGYDPVLLADQGGEVVAQVRAMRSGALLLDSALAARPYAADLIADLSAAAPQVAIVVLVRVAPSVGMVQAMEAGVAALVHRRCNPRELVAAVAAAIDGQNWVASDLAGVLRAELLAEVSGRPRPELSARELEVLQELATGATNNAIGARLGISQHTVRNHVQAVMRKLGVTTRTDAVASAIRMGLVELPH